MKNLQYHTKWALARLAKPRDGTGFSMLEAVVVVGVLLALAVGGFLSYGPITNNAKTAAVKSAVSEVYTALTVALIDGDPTTSPNTVVDTYNSSQDKIKLRLLPGVAAPAIPAMATDVKDYIPQSESDFCLTGSMIADEKIFAQMGSCLNPDTIPVSPLPTSGPTATTTPSPTVTPTPTATPLPTIPPAPAGYVDPTPTVTKLTYKCDASMSGTLPFNTISQGTLTIAGSDGSNFTKAYTNVIWTDSQTFKSGVTYTVSFDGKYSSLYQGNAPISACIRSLDHWGEQTGVINAKYGLQGATKLTSVPDHIPSTVTDLSDFFEGTTIFNDANVSKWNVSNVTLFTKMFYQAQTFNQPLNDWDMSKATSIVSMFSFTNTFNQPLDKWNTSNVTDMAGVFTYAKVFNQNINNWDVSKVTRMSDLFYNAAKFNQPLDKWNVSNVTKMDGMLRDTALFNQDIGMWKPSKVTNMDYMFAGNTLFRHDLSSWTFNVRPSRTAWAPTGLPTTSYPKF